MMDDITTLDGLQERYQSELDELQSDFGTDKEPEYDDDYWLSMARDAYDSSTDYLDSNIRKDWETAIAHQNGEHAPGSKYHTDAYRARSKTFRPKTRANNLNAEAQFARAVFATNDLVSITAINDNDEMQAASADINQQLLQYRLTHTIPWFLTVMGAFQDARVYGVCASYQAWEYDAIGDQVRKDEPTIDLLPPENIRFEPSADWRDPINTSPYMVRLVPMYAGEAKAKAEARGWREYSLGTYCTSASEAQDDSTRKNREGKGRIDPSESEARHNEFELIWLHENYIRLPDGDDYVYWTLGTKHLLSDPVPVQEMYPHLEFGERPVVLGYCVLEAHKNYPKSPTALIEHLQTDANDIANQRFDNVKLVLNKRYFIRRGATGADLQSLARNVPGGTVMVNDPVGDVRVVDTPDITGSSYQEQDRLDLQIDEITGAFSQQSVQNNRNLNETVGGMNLMSQGADSMSEYSFRVFIETWMEPVIRQLVRMEQHYETDHKILGIAADRAELYQKFGVDQVTDELLRAQLTVNVNVGFGNTNPQQKLERLNYAIQSVAMLPGMAERLDGDEIAKEVFGKSGYRDGQRFFKPIDENAQPPQPPVDPVAMAKVQIDQQRLQFEMQYKQAELQMRQEIEMAKIAATQNMKLEELYKKLGMEEQKLATQRQIEGTRLTLQQAQQALQATNLRQGHDTF
jgi:hypothetical protein